MNSTEHVQVKRTVKIDGKCEHVQKHLLLLNLKELQIEYLKHYEKTVGFSKLLSYDQNRVSL